MIKKARFEHCFFATLTLMRFVLIVLFFSYYSLAFGQCPSGQVLDCAGNCQPASWIGDGVCDDGVQFPSDFMCEAYNWDLGDCDDCEYPLIQDCNGNCILVSVIGNGVCNDDEAINFNCSYYDFDGGDCPSQGCTDPLATNYDSQATVDDGSCYYTPCPEGQFADCDGVCWDNEVLQYLANWHCNNTLWEGYLFEAAEIEVNFDCELFDYDGGDCLVWGCTDQNASNFYKYATNDDGSCLYGECPDGAMDCMGNCIPDNWIGLNECQDGLSDNPEDQLFNGAYPNSLAMNIPLPGEEPRGLCVLPDGSRAYIGTNDGVAVVGLEEVCEPVQLIPIDGIIYSCCSSLDGQHVFAANWSNGKVEVIETASNTVIQSIPTGSGTLKMRTSNNGQLIYCSNQNSNTVSVIDATTFNLITNINVGQMPRNICLSPDDSKLYVSNWRDWNMSVVNTETWETIAQVPVDYWPQAIWALPNDDYVLVANFGFDLTYDHISVIRVADWQVIARLQTGAGPEDMMSIGPNGEYLFVSNWGVPCCFRTTFDYCCSDEINEGSVTVIATPDFDALVPSGTVPDTIPYIQSTLTTVPLEAEYSFGMAAHPDGTAIYTVNKDSNSLSIIGIEGSTDDQAHDGDDCSNAKTLTSLSYCLEDCTVGYNDDYNEMCPFNELGASDLVYKFQPSFNQTVNIDLCESSFDTKMYIYEGTCGSFNSGEAIYCNDDYCGVNGWRSRLEDVYFQAGMEYYIVIDGWGANDKGEFMLCFENECPGDLNGDQLINVSDLLVFLTGFGSQFDTPDLLEFLSVIGEVCN